MSDAAGLLKVRLSLAESALGDIPDRHERAVRDELPEPLSPIRRWQPFDVRFDLDAGQWLMYMCDAYDRAGIVFVGDVACEPSYTGAGEWVAVSQGTWYLHVVSLGVSADGATWSVSQTAPDGSDLCVPLCTIAHGEVTTYHHGVAVFPVAPFGLMGYAPGCTELALLPGSGASPATDYWDAEEEVASTTRTFPSVRLATDLFLQTHQSTAGHTIQDGVLQFTRKLTFGSHTVIAGVSAEEQTRPMVFDTEEP